MRAARDWPSSSRSAQLDRKQSETGHGSPQRQQPFRFAGFPGQNPLSRVDNYWTRSLRTAIMSDMDWNRSALLERWSALECYRFPNISGLIPLACLQPPCQTSPQSTCFAPVHNIPHFRLTSEQDRCAIHLANYTRYWQEMPCVLGAMTRQLCVRK